MAVGLFPGQGVAAADVYASLPARDELLTIADDVLGYDLRRRVESAARRKGAKLPTLLAQPALFVAGLISLRAARDEGRSFDAYAGHSLGEYAALVAGDAFSFESGLGAVKARAEAMEDAAQASVGGMVAILGLDLDEVASIAERAGAYVANDNAPGQVVVSGPEAALAAAGEAARERGARAVLLEVSGPFHSPAIAPAERPLREALDHIEVRVPAVPVVSNVSARPYRAPGEIRSLLVEQLTGRVRFRESLQWLWEHGYREHEDLGPGRVAAGLAQRTFRALEREGATVDA